MSLYINPSFPPFFLFYPLPLSLSASFTSVVWKRSFSLFLIVNAPELFEFCQPILVILSGHCHWKILLKIFFVPIGRRPNVLHLMGAISELGALGLASFVSNEIVTRKSVWWKHWSPPFCLNSGADNLKKKKMSRLVGIYKWKNKLIHSHRLIISSQVFPVVSLSPREKMFNYWCQLSRWQSRPEN